MCSLFSFKSSIMDVCQDSKFVVLLLLWYSETVVWRCFIKQEILKVSQNSQENTCARVSCLIKLYTSAYSFVKKETLVQVLSCTFCETCKDVFCTKHSRATPSRYFRLFRVLNRHKLKTQGSNKKSETSNFVL